MSNSISERFARIKAEAAEQSRAMKLKSESAEVIRNLARDEERRVAESRLKSLGAILDGLHSLAVDLRVLVEKSESKVVDGEDGTPDEFDEGVRADFSELSGNVVAVVWQVESLARVVTDLTGDLYKSVLHSRSPLTSGSAGVVKPTERLSPEGGDAA